MPRIEIIPKDWETSQEKKNGNGTPTIDVCLDCAMDFVEDQPLEDEKLAKEYPGATVGSTDVVHPEYAEVAGTKEAYTCTCCERELTEEDEGCSSG